MNLQQENYEWGFGDQIEGRAFYASGKSGFYTKGYRDAMNAERIMKGDKFLGVVHEKNGKWYVTMCPPYRNLKTRIFRTCGNGVVRHPRDRSNQCSEAMTWDTREDAVIFLHNIRFLMEQIKDVIVVFRNEGDRQEMRGIFLSELGARRCIEEDLKANPEWKWIDFVMQEGEIGL